ncbi:MAG: cytochrome c [Sumerlaeia bacterium]
MSQHGAGEREATSVWAYVPMAVIGIVLVAWVFATGYLRGAHQGAQTPVDPNVLPKDNKPAVNVRALAQPDEELLKELSREGKVLYEVNCASCHGKEGYGDGDKGVGLNPPVRNFHESNPAAWTNGKSFAALWKTLHEGANGSMSNYRHLPEDDRVAIVHYMSKWIPEQPELTEDDLASLPTGREAGAGTVAPMEAPEPPPVEIGVAMKLLLEERGTEPARSVQ